MSRTYRHDGYLSRDRFYRFPRYTGYYGEGIRKRRTRKWFKRTANKALRRAA